MAIRVALVSPEREVWAGQAEMVVAQTIEGEIGIRTGHAPVLGVLVDGSVVKIFPEGGEVIVAAVGSGFFSVADNEVSVLAEQAELGAEIDLAEAREALATAQAAGDGDNPQAVAERRARARLRAAGADV
ncbi:F0F1 ATP synthase subunit epsilon [Actinocorallia sp. API 0066]|uniref:F0F1 ATP synthase subunit epsilon n=1 Tax=Actinocorallia sp. API 0066 TaxID=2896846 RepID=UPI001E50322E|nr:F0F1 ATP synthase subunit epsilon [Actinocorallia sp. API 0066]MCD0451334.1 F0F1 ATP synthase subunit epsilon [Actinocorallia sp. API 0066]